MDAGFLIYYYYLSYLSTTIYSTEGSEGSKLAGRSGKMKNKMKVWGTPPLKMTPCIGRAVLPGLFYNAGGWKHWCGVSDCSVGVYGQVFLHF
jgi:hypothetical protein